MGFYLLVIIIFCVEEKTSQIWWNLCLIISLRVRKIPVGKVKHLFNNSRLQVLGDIFSFNCITRIKDEKFEETWDVQNLSINDNVSPVPRIVWPANFIFFLIISVKCGYIQKWNKLYPLWNLSTLKHQKLVRGSSEKSLNCWLQRS